MQLPGGADLCEVLITAYAVKMKLPDGKRQPGDSFPGAGLFIGIYFGRMFLETGLLIS